MRRAYEHKFCCQGNIGPDSRFLPEPKILTLNDQQIETIGCISDAEMLARNTEKEHVSREKYFQYCFTVALTAIQEGYWGDLSDYIEKFDVASNGRDEKGDDTHI